MKKRIYNILGLFILILALWSCEDLKREVTTDLTEEQVFKSYDFYSYTVSSVYASLPTGFAPVGGAMLASVCDEAEFTNDLYSVQKLNSGSWSQLTNPDDTWSTNYQAIRKANNVLANSGQVDLEAYRLDPSLNATYLLRLAEMKRWNYEVRFLRAFFHWELVKRYGGVPIITDLIGVADDYKNLKRNTLDECIKFITSECDSAANNLPATPAATDLGRITKGIALALKSQVLLYAASDLYNSSTWAGSYSNPELISLTGDRKTKWKSAVDAAKAVIDLNLYNTLNADYKGLFNAYNLPEIIFCRRDGASNSFERTNFSIGPGFEGNSGNTPSQNLVDEYEVKVSATVAVPFDWNNPTHAANPYATTGATARDSRLQKSIVVNNSSFHTLSNYKRNMEIWAGGKDGKGKERATKTGYYLRKYVDEGVDLVQNKSSVHNWILIRMAEIYLNYAEALNEYEPGSTEILTNLNKTRLRASMPPITVTDQALLREAIRKERRIELAFEGHRWFDVRRWMQGEKYFNVPLKGVSIEKKDDGSFVYTVINVENRVFEPKMNWYPIPQREMNKYPDWKQNPLW